MNRGRGTCSALVAAAFVVAAVGCSGGEVQSRPRGPVTASYLPATLSFTRFDDSLSTAACTSVDFTPYPDGLDSIRFTDDGAVFHAGNVSVLRTDAFGANLCFAFDPTVAAGEHAGTLTMTLCEDPACASTRELTPSTVAYSGTVYHVVTGQPLLDASFELNRAVATPASTGSRGEVRTYGFAITLGQDLEVDVGAPVVMWYEESVTGVPEATAHFARSVHMLNGTGFVFELPAGATHGAIVLTGRTEEGRTVEITVNVTR
jgi:hypothetical protein